MKRYFYQSLLVVLAMALGACESDDTDFSEYTDGTTAEETIVPIDIALDDSGIDEPVEVFSADDSDYEENTSFKSQVTVSFSGSTATVSGDVGRLSVSQDGAHVTISSTAKNVEYVLSGTTANGSLKVYSENKYKLVLNGVNITNPTGAAINNQGNKTLYVVLADGTENMLADGSSYAATGNEDLRGTFFSEGQMVFSGSGRLSVYANSKNGIASDDYIRVRPGCNIYVNSTASHAFKAKDGLFVGGGVINIEVSGSGAKGLNCDKHIEISGGRTTILTSGGARVEAADTTASAGIKCDSVFVMSDGIVNIKSTGDGGKGVNTNMDFRFTGGALNVVTLGPKGLSSPKGLKSDKNMIVSGGSIYSYSANSVPLDVKGTLSVAPGYAAYSDKPRLVEIRY